MVLDVGVSAAPGESACAAEASPGAAGCLACTGVYVFTGSNVGVEVFPIVFSLAR